MKPWAKNSGVSVPWAFFAGLRSAQYGSSGSPMDEFSELSAGHSGGFFS